MKLSLVCVFVSIAAHALLLAWQRIPDLHDGAVDRERPAFEVVSLTAPLDEVDTAPPISAQDTQDVTEVDGRATNLAAPGVLEQPDADGHPQQIDDPEPIASGEAVEEPVPPQGVGVEGLPLPPSVYGANSAPVLVLDHRIDDFEAIATKLGFQFIVFENLPSPKRYFEISGPGFRQRRIRREIDKTTFSTRAFDFTHVPRFRALRLELAERCFIEPRLCRFAAVVPHALRNSFAVEEQRALEQLARDPATVRALFGTLRQDPASPLRVTAAMLDDGKYIPVQ